MTFLPKYSKKFTAKVIENAEKMAVSPVSIPGRAYISDIICNPDPDIRGQSIEKCSNRYLFFNFRYQT